LSRGQRFLQTGDGFRISVEENHLFLERYAMNRATEEASELSRSLERAMGIELYPQYKSLVL
jgi:hypothetical protein